jgi:hypothetical protein
MEEDDYRNMKKPPMPPKTLQIRNSVAEFLIFTKQTGENGIEVCVQNGTIWLSQKIALFESYAKNTRIQNTRKKI